ncbi:hypothetical protein [Dipodfec virus UOA04_Rod_868]|nr:hypothetical protein [Dipodfec virus UOA04_Rod_868]
MGAVKHYSVNVNGVSVYNGPIRTAEIVYRAFESYFNTFYLEGKSSETHIKSRPSLVLSFKL